MADIDKSSSKYKHLVDYMKKNINKASFSEIKAHLKKQKWPEEWINEAKKEVQNQKKASKSSKSKTGNKKHSKASPISKSGGLMKKAKDEEKAMPKGKSSSGGLMHKAKGEEGSVQKAEFGEKFEKVQKDISEIKENTINDKRSYVQSLFEKHEDPRHFYQRPTEEKELKNSLSEKETSKIMKDALSLAKQVVSTKQQASQSQVEKLFDVQQEEEIKEDLEDTKRQAELERKNLEREKKEFEIRKKKLKEKKQEDQEEIRPTPRRQVAADEESPSDHGAFSEKLQMIESKLSAYDNDEKNYRNPVIEEEIEYTLKPLGNRAETGIQGLDPIMQGGIRRESVTMIAGGPGSGKTIFGMQFLVNGVTMFDEPGIFITFEQTRDELKKIFIQFDWDLDQLEKEGKLIVLKLNPEQVNKLLEAGGGTLRDAIESMRARRLVIDSMSDFLMLYKDDLQKRTACINLFTLLDKMGVTSLVISEQETDPLKHVSNILEYQVDGVVLLYNERVGHIRQRAIEIFKMRGTKHAGRIFPMTINSQGIKIKSNLE